MKAESYAYAPKAFRGSGMDITKLISYICPLNDPSWPYRPPYPSSPMRKSRPLILVLLTFTALTALFSCGEDRWPEYYVYTGRDLWIDSVMRQHYLWYDQMPEFDDLNYFRTPSTFLSTVISDDDDFSSVDTLDNSLATGYGFEYSLSTATDNDTAYYAMVTYVMTDSPAAEAGLERGEWVMTIDGEWITGDNDTLLDSGSEARFLIGKYQTYTTVTDDTLETETTGVLADRTITMPAAREVDDDIVPVSTIVNDAVGYIVYNSFDPDADEALLNFSALCAEAGVTDVVVDLRYNEGGDISSAQLLATLLCPASALGSDMATLEYNDLQTAKNRTLTFDSDLLTGGAQNLNLSTVYFLTTATTSGTAEVLIHCLQPYMDVVTLGRTTDGFYIGTEDFTNTTYNWVLHLAVCHIYNADGEEFTSSGFSPDKTVNHLNNALTVLPLGDPDEAMLSAALSLINGD